jgi:hypothetical protein
MSQATGAVIGNAGGSVAQVQHFGEVGKVGARGETRTAQLLARLALRPGGPTIIHDLRIPIPGFKANIDHAVISGKTVTLIDTKVWKDGVYWTLGGVTRVGVSKAPHADKKTLPTGVEGISRALQRLGVAASFRRSILLIWPTSPNLNTTFYRPAGAVAVVARSEDFALSKIARHTGTKSADPRLVAAMTQFIY